MGQDHFAQYAVADADPFAAFAEAPPPDPMELGRQRRADDTETSKRLFMGKWADPDYRGESAGTVIGELALMAALGGAGKLASKIPGGRLLTAGKAAAKAGINKMPLIGQEKTLRAAAEAGYASMKATAPKVAQAATQAAPAVVAGVKPKLSAQQVAEALRTNYGSEKAGRMLYGPVRPGVPAAGRKEAIKRLAPGESALPKSAATRMDKELAASTADEAFAYAGKAKSDKAKAYLGDLLRASLLAKMKK